MLNQPIYETFVEGPRTYERRSEWSSHGYAYVTMHGADSRHGWGGIMRRSEWNLSGGGKAPEGTPAERAQASA
jgi:hypothetical protein